MVHFPGYLVRMCGINKLFFVVLINQADVFINSPSLKIHSTDFSKEKTEDIRSSGMFIHNVPKIWYPRTFILDIHCIFLWISATEHQYYGFLDQGVFWRTQREHNHCFVYQVSGTSSGVHTSSGNFSSGGPADTARKHPNSPFVKCIDRVFFSR